MRIKGPHNFHGYGLWPVYKVALSKQWVMGVEDASSLHVRKNLSFGGDFLVLSAW